MPSRYPPLSVLRAAYWSLTNVEDTELTEDELRVQLYKHCKKGKDISYQAAANHLGLEEDDHKVPARRRFRQRLYTAVAADETYVHCKSYNNYGRVLLREGLTPHAKQWRVPFKDLGDEPKAVNDAAIPLAGELAAGVVIKQEK